MTMWISHTRYHALGYFNRWEDLRWRTYIVWTMNTIGNLRHYLVVNKSIFHIIFIDQVREDVMDENFFRTFSLDFSTFSKQVITHRCEFWEIFVGVLRILSYYDWKNPHHVRNAKSVSNTLTRGSFKYAWLPQIYCVRQHFRVLYWCERETILKLRMVIWHPRSII